MMKDEKDEIRSYTVLTDHERKDWNGVTGTSHALLCSLHIYVAQLLLFVRSMNLKKGEVLDCLCVHSYYKYNICTHYRL